MTTGIRPARPGDVEAILGFIAGLAEYEKLTAELDLCPDRLHAHLFGSPPACWALMAEEEGRPVGFALFCTTYSTFKTASCLHLEDLYVTPAARGRGHGQALLRAVAAEAVARGVPRLQWCVLDWNEPAIELYRALGAEVLPDWRVCRVEGPAIAALGGGG